MRKFRDVLSRWEAGSLSQAEAAELLGRSERQGASACAGLDGWGKAV
jgi:hypothetical protein